MREQKHHSSASLALGASSGILRYPYRIRKETVFLKTIRLARLALALTPLSLGLAVLNAPVPVCAAPASSDGLPPGTPPLTATQHQKQQALIQRYIQDIKALSTKPGLTPLQKEKQGMALQASLRQNMLSILTPKQRSMVEAQNNKVLDLKKQFAKEHQGEITQLRQLTAKLASVNAATQKSLSPTQKQKIKALQDQARTQLQKIEAQNTSNQVKQETAQAVVRDAQRQAFSILTPAQQKPLLDLQNKIVALQTNLGKELTDFAKSHGQ
jgi:hypothetical protein